MGLAFDTLNYAETLKAAGVPEAQAKAQAQALAEALRESGQGVATKLDLTALEGGIQAALNRQLQIMLGVMVAMTGIFAAIVKLL